MTAFADVLRNVNRLHAIFVKISKVEFVFR
jgi:hypothetical protein